MQWSEIKTALQGVLPEPQYQLWIEPLVCNQVNSAQLDLVCVDPYFMAYFANKYLQLVRDVLKDNNSGLEVRLVLVANQKNSESAQTHKRKSEGQLRLPTIPEARNYTKSLHPRFTFDQFVEGDSNNLACSACQAIAEGDDTIGTSLYINAGPGLGKSHLTHAVAHHINTHFPGTRLHYLTVSQFSSEMVRQIRSNGMDEFKNKYLNNCDVLLIEDTQALAGKTKTQHELNDILDALTLAGKRVILTGVSLPGDISGIDSIIKSRISGSLISTITPPGLQTRKGIALRKAQNCELVLEKDLVEYLAENIRGDIRLIESAIVGLKARASLTKKNPDIDMLKDIIPEIVKRRELSAEVIRDFVADQFRISVEDLRSRARQKNITFPRQISMFLARKYTNQGLAEIGRAFNRDHATVIHSIDVITRAIARNKSTSGQVAMLASKLGVELDG